MRNIKLDTLEVILNLTKASQLELFNMLNNCRTEDNIVVCINDFKTPNDRRCYNKRIKPIKDIGLIKLVDIKLDKGTKTYPYLMLNPNMFPTHNERLTRLLWSGY